MSWSSSPSILNKESIASVNKGGAREGAVRVGECLGELVEEMEALEVRLVAMEGRRVCLRRERGGDDSGA